LPSPLFSRNTPEYPADVDGLGTLRLLDAIREARVDTRIYQASTSELYGNAAESPQDEQTPFQPRSPYGCAKLYAYWITRNYREAYDMHASNGILFNHESPRRGERFVTRKITRGAAHIKAGLLDRLYLGNLDASRDWGYAPEYVRGMWLMMQQETPDDYVLATGETHTVREFAGLAFQAAGFDLAWEGEDEEEVGIDRNSGRKLIVVDPRYYRPAEVHSLIGDPSKAERELGWRHETSFEELVEKMVAADLENVKTNL